MVDMRSFVEREWDARVAAGRKDYVPPMSSMMWTALTRRGSAHLLDPSDDWLRWDRTLKSLLNAWKPAPKSDEVASLSDTGGML